VGLYSLEILQCQNDISTLKKIKDRCSTLISQNKSYDQQLVQLAASYSGAIMIEDEASFQVKLKGISSSNHDFIAAIESAINARISSLSTELAYFRNLEQKDAIRRAAESANRQISQS
jgi:hypothetical protein